MKSRIQSIMLACVALTGAFMASCTDDALMEASEKYAGRPFELTVSQSAPDSRLALGQNGLFTEWEPGDKLVLVDKAGGKAPIYLTCTLSENASKAKFASESGVPSGDYYVIYNYNEDLAYTHKQFQSIEQINADDDLVLWAELNVPENTYSANVTLQHLYAKFTVELTGVPDGLYNFHIGMYSSKKGFPVYQKFTSTGLVNAEYGIDPNSMYSSNYTYFASNRKYHNIGLGQYMAEYNWDEQTASSSYDWSKAKKLSALVLPADLEGEDVFFYVLDVNSYTCYEIKKSGKDFKAGISYKVQLDLSTATVSTLTQSTSSDPMMPNSYYQIEDAADWRHAAYRNEGSYEVTADIDFEDEYFFPINAYELKGSEKTLSNIALDWSDEDNVGLIKTDAGSSMGMTASESYSKVSNLTLENVTFKGNNYVGAFGGKNVYADNCSVIGTSTITGKGDYVGGIVGRNSFASESNYMVKASVGQSCAISGKNYVGGIVGRYMEDYMGGGIWMNSSRVLMEDCTSKATVTATGDYVGGIFGKIGGNQNNSNSSLGFSDSNNTYTFSIIKCKNEGNVTGVNYVGGIGGDFAVYYWDSSVVDRIVLKESYSEGNVTGTQKVAGILGASSASINTCYSIGEISASDTEAAGIVGYMDGMTNGGTARIANCYSLATLTAGTSGKIGGIIARAGGMTITNCYYAADPNTYTFGGIVGESFMTCNVTNCLTTLSSLGGLGNHLVYDKDTNGDWITDSNDTPSNYPDVTTGSEVVVASIKDKLTVINGDQKYSTNLWSTTTYPWNCVKFASFEVDTDSPNYGQDSL